MQLSVTTDIVLLIIILFIASKYDQSDYTSVFKILDVTMCAFLPSAVDTRGRHLSTDPLFCRQHNNCFQILMYKLIAIFMYLSSAERNNRIFGLFVRNGDIRMFSSQ